ncbi:MAG: hypothetical protein HQK83_10315 [Fibrobacteria bacterium]|nr:hypothetical protein [Fibrobacteria bacterium]
METSEAIDLLETTTVLVTVLAITACLLESKTQSEREMLSKALSAAVERGRRSLNNTQYSEDYERPMYEQF